jgi:hydroxyacylglutathione hydrolase
MVIDTRKHESFATGHVPRTINIPVKYLAAWAGWLVDYDAPLYLLTSEADRSEAVRILHKIGIDQIEGYFESREVGESGLNTQTFPEATPDDIHKQVAAGKVTLIDVRGDSEWKEQHIEQAKRCFLAGLPQKLAEFKGDCTLAFHCRSGGRSAIAASLAQAAGINKVINMKGGITAWVRAGLPVVTNYSEVTGPHSDASTIDAANQSQAVFWEAQCPPKHEAAPSGV